PDTNKLQCNDSFALALYLQTNLGLIAFVLIDFTSGIVENCYQNIKDKLLDINGVNAVFLMGDLKNENRQLVKHKSCNNSYLNSNNSDDIVYDYDDSLTIQCVDYNLIPMTIGNDLLKRHTSALGNFMIKKAPTLNDLPNDIIQSQLMMNMDIEQLANYCQTNQTVSNICHSKTFWRQKFKQDGVHYEAVDNKNYASYVMNNLYNIIKYNEISFELSSDQITKDDLITFVSTLFKSVFNIELLQSYNFNYIRIIMDKNRLNVVFCCNGDRPITLNNIILDDKWKKDILMYVFYYFPFLKFIKLN